MIICPEPETEIHSLELARAQPYVPASSHSRIDKGLSRRLTEDRRLEQDSRWRNTRLIAEEFAANSRKTKTPAVVFIDWRCDCSLMHAASHKAHPLNNVFLCYRPMHSE